ncbi:Spx/MgsR family RNA polymerase-binding regulatory protein [Cecembia calidifontis]|jgi:Spx/MgsR family transcriptional regulator|uniref:Spx/MgsR family transcriptional regulator n=1 Tax=Cecembia calidifontis TaxID=1187080 RepID=A0A4Q7P7Y0_9BACT|nr:Spx/MgsR family RNA polymerase-binding regulatory protein [Cecembia calidifontis]RZS96165.1 Spx/MgsR family transcriptional regulator [Cecembia calidifontis]
MKLRVYGIKNCDTMKKTFVFLENKGLDYEFIDYKKNAPDTALLSGFADKVGFENLINKKGTTYRKLDDQEKKDLETKSNAIALLSEKSSMIKRPIIEFPDGSILLGLNEEEIIKKAGK